MTAAWLCLKGYMMYPRGVSYNSYLLMDEKTVLFDTVDHSVDRVFFENIDHVLAGRKLDALVVQHMEPDHAATIQGGGPPLSRSPDSLQPEDRQYDGPVLHL